MQQVDEEIWTIIAIKGSSCGDESENWISELGKDFLGQKNIVYLVVFSVQAF
jgi:hypothetical protein